MRRILALKEVEKVDSKNANVLASLCATYMHVGMMKEALSVAKKWQKIAPDSPNGLYHAGFAEPL